jgi:acyl-CoA thioester hydrolase
MNDAVPAAPMLVHEDTVRPEWIDYNGHMNVAYYVLVFDCGTDGLFDRLGLGEAYRLRTGRSLFAVETRISYRAEARLGERLRVESQLLGADAKRVRFFHRMFLAGGALAATYEALGLNVDLATRRAAPFDAATAARLAAVAAAHEAAGIPPEAGRGIALGRPG